MNRPRYLLCWVVMALLTLLATPGLHAAKTCYECHTKQKQLYNSRKFVHEPTKKENCESCHKRHGFAQSLILTTTTNDLCYSCHADLKAEYDKANVHFPVAKGKCWDCHDPHSSDKQGLLRAAPEGFDDPNGCLMCHKSELEESLHAGVAHQPFAELDCVRCHAPHASEHGGLLVAPANDLCGSCHDPKSGTMQTTHADRHISGLLCTDCHSGHSGPEKGLLSDKTHAPFAEGECETCHSLPDASGKVTIEEGVAINDLCTTCHGDIAEMTGLAHPHAAVSTDNCTDCHQSHSSRHGNLLVAPEGELCGQCHDDLLTSSGKTPHLPAVLGQCSSCHEPHGSSQEHLLVKSGADLCLDCHTDFKANRDSATTVHAAAEDCRLCHSPHEGVTAAILKGDPSELCRDCHAVDEAALSAVSGHHPYLTANCLGCHEPHHSDTPHLVRGEGKEMCLTCHADIQNRLTMTHPHAGADDCTVCHTPHYSSSNLHLLSAHEEQLCESCHSLEDLNMTAEFVHTPARMGDCSGCHNPHGAMQENLVTGRMQRVVIDGKVVGQLPRLTGLSADLCYTCHDDLVEPFRQQGVHQPVAEGKCDACHSPHGSSHAGVLTAGAPELCAGCHEVNAVLESKHEGYALGSANCLECHNPHVSEQPKLVRSTLHPPFAEKSCEACHEKGTQGEVVLSGGVSELCSACHESVSEGAELAHQHVPFAAGSCSACHGIHAADQPGLLRADGAHLCTSCHSDVRDQAGLAVQHKPFVDGQCLDCHRPHSSQFANLKTKPDETFCLGCHTDLADRIANGEPHAPVMTGDCSACHEAHAGENHSLLTKTKENLCGECHELASADMTTAHSGFAVAATNCQNCHEAHASPKGVKGLLLPSAHSPFAAGDCSSCHENKQATQLVTTTRTLCLTCHSDFGETLNKPVVHAPVRDENGCTSCHGPHVGYGKALQKQQGVATCLECHNTAEFTSAVQHPPAFENCGTCHEVHAGEHKGLLNTADIMELCLTCHEKAKETHYHPMGEGITDPRTKQDLNCIGCHSPHSSPYERILVADRDRKLCVVCHNVSH